MAVTDFGTSGVDQDGQISVQFLCTGGDMTIDTTYTQARAHLAELCDRATNDRETIIIRRRNAGAVALVAADELESLTETAHLLRSSANAERLLAALARARGEVAAEEASGTDTRAGDSLAVLRGELGLGEEEG
jgi:antitoxin YefM